jgi:hypothetical protein
LKRVTGKEQQLIDLNPAPRVLTGGTSELVLKILWSYVKEMVRFDVYNCSEKARYQPSYFERSLLMLALDKDVFIGKDEEADCDREMEGNKQGRFQEEGHDEENKEDEGREEFNAALKKFDPFLAKLVGAFLIAIYPEEHYGRRVWLL